MRIIYRLLLFTAVFAFLFFTYPQLPVSSECSSPFPYASQGLNQRQAAAHLISRFTYGAKPGQVDEVVKMGLENWFQLQLRQAFKEDTLQQKLDAFRFLQLSNQQVVDVFPRPARLLKMAAEDGGMSRDSLKSLNREDSREAMRAFMQKKGLHQQAELVRELINQRIVRAVYANNQLKEVMTGFWFNHFNVSLTKNTCIVLVPAYERDAIRPHVLGKFSDLLIATAQSPAMLVYLDNNLSVGDNDSLQNPESTKRLERLQSLYEAADDTAKATLATQIKKAKNAKGLNENYAREVMELHTLGVDGGYTQSDVTQAARILTGWGVYPFDEAYGPATARLIKQKGEDQLLQNGFVRKGDFFFSMNKHDIKEKKLLGKTFKAGIGYEEGEAMLQMLAHHPSTAKFISSKLATYFVSDHPPASLIEKMSASFIKNDGDIAAVLTTMVNTPEFWSVAAVRQKIKSPFELAVSAVRALDADMNAPYQLFSRMERMGEKIYYYQAPTGFPDRADYWINSGSLLQRMNFGLDITSGKMRGLSVDLLKLNQQHEAEGPDEALKIYANLLLPERETAATVKRLAPLLRDPELSDKLNRNLDRKKQSATANGSMEEDELSPTIDMNDKTTMNMLAQVVGMIIGSPEFQRR